MFFGGHGPNEGPFLASAARSPCLATPPAPSRYYLCVLSRLARGLRIAAPFVGAVGAVLGPCGFCCSPCFFRIWERPEKKRGGNKRPLSAHAGARATPRGDRSDRARTARPELARGRSARPDAENAAERPSRAARQPPCLFLCLCARRRRRLDFFLVPPSPPALALAPALSTLTPTLTPPLHAPPPPPKTKTQNTHTS
jgi:hypothetical protein